MPETRRPWKWRGRDRFQLDFWEWSDGKEIKGKEIVSDDFYSPANDIGLIYKDNKLIKDYDVAAKWFEFGVKYNDKYALYNYGNLYTYNDFISKSYVKAEKLYQKALEIDSDYILPYEGLGKLYYYG